MPVLLDEELGEIVCPECEGYGAIPRICKLEELQMVCPKCQGIGKLDWCQQAVGVPPPTSKNYKASFTDFAEDFLHDDNKDILPFQQMLLDKLAKDMADKIDAEILESLQGDLEHNTKEKSIYRGSIYDHRVLS